MDPAKLAKLQAQAAANRIGGKGTPRRKIVRKPKAAGGGDDKKLQAALKKLNVQPIAGVEEVNMFREDGNVLHFSAPKDHCLLCELSLRVLVHAAVSANTYAIFGNGQLKELTELVPGILNQLGPDSLASLRKLAESYQAIQQGQQARQAAGAEDDDDDVPDLVENFDVEAEEPPAAETTEEKAEEQEKIDELN
ncbi:NAC-domain-containing protein [Coniophora puteana RWD-64-598 SS2]|uniref:Nascent polypeptide-associated complex subunit beta n=1 Tax=Coniophora puteana (strain RWD-64-598) TaxID=741705 RepID=A0A5M3MGM8_CONPW|nr:NAC-domain-containing protein [Coniophora puteana RWD-64-598 SS2]EIW78389.1 NAC-domain-containing protein [Coniophora puteana RWD-64-598 SS2]